MCKKSKIIYSSFIKPGRWIFIIFLLNVVDHPAMLQALTGKGRVGKGISAQASHRTVLEILTSHGSSHSA